MRRQGAALTCLSGNNSSAPKRLIEAEPEQSPSKAGGDRMFWASVQGGTRTPYSEDRGAEPALRMPTLSRKSRRAGPRATTPSSKIGLNSALVLGLQAPWGPGPWDSELFGGGGRFISASEPDAFADSYQGLPSPPSLEPEYFPSSSPTIGTRFLRA